SPLPSLFLAPSLGGATPAPGWVVSCGGWPALGAGIGVAPASTSSGVPLPASPQIVPAAGGCSRTRYSTTVLSMQALPAVKAVWPSPEKVRSTADSSIRLTDTADLK